MEFSYDSLVAMESGLEFVLDTAMEGVNADAFKARKATMKEVRAMAKEMNAAAKAGDYKTAAEKARGCASKFDELKRLVNDMDQSTSSAVLIDLALALAAIVAIAATAFGLAKAGKAIGKKVGAKKGLQSARNTQNGTRLNKAEQRMKGRIEAKEVARGEGGLVSAANAHLAKSHAKELEAAQSMANSFKGGANKEVMRKSFEAQKSLKGQNFEKWYAKQRAKAFERVTELQSNAGKAAHSARNMDAAMSIASNENKQRARQAASNAVKGYSDKFAGRMEKLGAARGQLLGKKAGALAGGGVTSTAIGAFLAKKGFLGANKSGEKLQPNDVNALLNHYRKSCDDGKKRYTELAKMYDEMAAVE